VPDMAPATTATQVDGAHGPLSPARSRAILEGLERGAEDTNIFDRHLALEQAVSDSPLLTGNRVRLLEDGPETYRAMFTAIMAARDHINMETYILEDDEVGQRFADALIEKQRQGVQVNLIHDSVGTLGTPAEFFQRLRDSGVRTLEFNPVNPATAKAGWDVNQRDHRKLLIVDGRTVFLGGINISGVYSGSSFRGNSKTRPDGALPWRDTDLQIDGPVVAEFQKLFLDTWARGKGPELPKRDYFPELKRKGRDLVLVVGSTPGQENRVTYIMYVSAFAYAERFIHVTNAYFVPDEQTVEALTGAARRGVDVRLILPGASDEGPVFHAGRSYYTELLESGVKLYELRSSMLHAKTAVIDGVWSTVGSTNMDLWSFLRNDEVNAIFLGRDFAEEMERMFQTDLEQSREILLSRWKKRPFKDRFREWFTRLFQHWL